MGVPQSVLLYDTVWYIFLLHIKCRDCLQMGWESILWRRLFTVIFLKVILNYLVEKTFRSLLLAGRQLAYFAPRCAGLTLGCRTNSSLCLELILCAIHTQLFGSSTALCLCKHVLFRHLPWEGEESTCWEGTWFLYMGWVLLSWMALGWHSPETGKN